MIYTSYFEKTKAISAADPSAVMIAVCGGLPPYWKDGPNAKWLRKVAPKWNWWSEWREKFKDNYESDESKLWYGEKYRTTVLYKLDPAQILTEISGMAPPGANIYLLCYEKPDMFCHRHMLAAWLNLRVRANIKEWDG